MKKLKTLFFESDEIITLPKKQFNNIFLINEADKKSKKDDEEETEDDTDHSGLEGMEAQASGHDETESTEDESTDDTETEDEESSEDEGADDSSGLDGLEAQASGHDDVGGDTEDDDATDMGDGTDTGMNDGTDMGTGTDANGVGATTGVEPTQDGENPDGVGDQSLDGDGQNQGMGMGQEGSEDNNKKIVLFKNYKSIYDLISNFSNKVTDLKELMDNDNTKKSNYEAINFIEEKLESLKENLKFILTDKIKTMEYEKAKTIFTYIKSEVNLLSNLFNKISNIKQ